MDNHSNQEIFKAGMITAIKYAHLQLTGRPYDKEVKWTANDQRVLEKGMREHGISGGEYEPPTVL